MTRAIVPYLLYDCPIFGMKHKIQGPCLIFVLPPNEMTIQ